MIKRDCIIFVSTGSYHLFFPLEHPAGIREFLPVCGPFSTATCSFGMVAARSQFRSAQADYQDIHLSFHFGNSFRQANPGISLSQVYPIKHSYHFCKKGEFFYFPACCGSSRLQEQRIIPPRTIGLCSLQPINNHCGCVRRAAV